MSTASTLVGGSARLPWSGCQLPNSSSCFPSFLAPMVTLPQGCPFSNPVWNVSLLWASDGGSQSQFSSLPGPPWSGPCFPVLAHSAAATQASLLVLGTVHTVSPGFCAWSLLCSLISRYSAPSPPQTITSLTTLLKLQPPHSWTRFPASFFSVLLSLSDMVCDWFNWLVYGPGESASYRGMNTVSCLNK